MNNLNTNNLRLYLDYLKEHGTPLKLKMTDYLRGWPDSRYVETSLAITDVNEKKVCHTCACLVGNAPLTGIPELAIHPDDIAWPVYCKRVFGVYYFYQGSDVRNYLFQFLFGDFWPDDLGDAIGRIEHVLETGKAPLRWDRTWKNYVDSKNPSHTF